MRVILRLIFHKIGSHSAHNVLHYLIMPVAFLSWQIDIVVYCILFENHIDFLVLPFRNNLKFGKRYTFYIFLIYSQECLLVCGWVLYFFNHFIYWSYIVISFKFDGNIDNGMQLLRLKEKYLQIYHFCSW